MGCDFHSVHTERDVVNIGRRKECAKYSNYMTYCAACLHRNVAKMMKKFLPKNFEPPRSPYREADPYAADGATGAARSVR